MASAIICDGPGCDQATADSILDGWVRVTVNPLRGAVSPLPEGDYDFHHPACLRKWVVENSKAKKAA